jgi:hypothetical protein
LGLDLPAIRAAAALSIPGHLELGDQAGSLKLGKGAPSSYGPYRTAKRLALINVSITITHNKPTT